MASHKIPCEPLLVVLGSTGTGKSDLAVELARRFNGEVINSDAMQLYNGLPIITNKITNAEQKGIPHHLLGHIALHEAPWNVEFFKREATRVIGEIRARGNLPILVGGTQYYVDPLLFTDVILDGLEQPTDLAESYPLLNEPTDVLLEQLRKCDPVMAERWHPNDRRKILRSLEIYLHTGKPASELYAEQEARRACGARENKAPGPWDKLLFWVYSDKEVLVDRLDRRVEKMYHSGLLDEVHELYMFKKKTQDEGKEMDTTRGIFQAIGFKQFEPYLEALDSGQDASDAERLKLAGLEDMKTATRRYAKYQTKWIRLKKMRRLQDEGPDAVSNLYLVDSTDVSKFEEKVVKPAALLTDQFLKGQPRQSAVDLSETARQVLGSVIQPPPKETPAKRTCEQCQTVLVTEEAWQKHLKSARHRRITNKKKRRALAVVQDAAADERSNGSDFHQEASESERSYASSPDLGSVFS